MKNEASRLLKNIDRNGSIWSYRKGFTDRHVSNSTLQDLFFKGFNWIASSKKYDNLYNKLLHTKT